MTTTTTRRDERPYIIQLGPHVGCLTNSGAGPALSKSSNDDIRARLRLILQSLGRDPNEATKIVPMPNRMNGGDLRRVIDWAKRHGQRVGFIVEGDVTQMFRNLAAAAGVASPPTGEAAPTDAEAAKPQRSAAVRAARRQA